MNATGTITTDGVRFERIYDAAPAEVWRALTEPEQLARWLHETTSWSLTPGDEWSITFEDGAVRGRVVAAEPERLLELTWIEPGGESRVRFELEPQGSGCLLVLDHSRLPLESRTGFGAGWQAHLEALDALLSGGGELDWWARFAELQPAYEQLAATG